MAGPNPAQQIGLVEERLDKIEATLESLSPKPNVGKIARSWQWIINHKATSIILSVILCVAGAYLKYWLDHRNDGFNDAVDARVSKVLSAPRGVNDTLKEERDTTNKTQAELETLQPFIRDVITHQFESTSKLPVNALGERLPAIRNLVALARNQNVKVPTDVIASINQKLISTDKGAKEYWPAAAELISYRSELLHPSNGTSLPNCIPRGTLGTAGDAYRNCVIDLDNKRGYAFAITCTHCLVRYSGGPVKVTGFFVDCVYMINLTDNPNPDPTGQRLEAELLASDLKNVTVKSPT